MAPIALAVGSLIPGLTAATATAVGAGIMGYGGAKLLGTMDKKERVLPPLPGNKVSEAEQASRRRALIFENRSGTLLTGGLGLTEQAAVQKKTLLGQ